MGYDLFPHYFDAHFGTPNAHREVLREFLLDDPKWTAMDRKVVVKMHRESSKSTLLFLYGMRCILYTLKHFWINFSKSKRQSIDTLEKVKHELETNRKVHEHFGNFRVHSEKDLFTGKWRQDLLVTNTGFRFESLGIKQGMRGVGHWQWRPDLISGDDAEDEENAATPEMRLRNWNKYRRAVLQALDLYKGQAIYIYTPEHEECIGERLMKMKSWRKISYGAYTTVGSEAGPILWPKKFTKEILEKKKQEFVEANDIEGWAREWLCACRSEQTAEFKREWLKDYEGRYVWEDGKSWLHIDKDNSGTYKIGEKVPINVVVGVDLAGSKERKLGSQTVFFVWAVCPKRHLWDLELVVGNFPTFEIADRFFYFYDKYHNPRFSAEKNAFQTLLYGDGFNPGFLHREMLDRGKVFRIEKLEHEVRNKDMRIESMIPWAQAGAIHVRPNNTPFIMAALDYRSDDSRPNDILDAAHKGMKIARPAQKLRPKPDIDPFYQPERFVTTATKKVDLWVR